MKFVKIALVGALLAGAAYAKGDATDPSAKAREDVMKAIGGSLGTLGRHGQGRGAL